MDAVWHSLGPVSDFIPRIPFTQKVDRYHIAFFHYQGEIRAIANGCNHKGGPLCDGRMRAEYVMCPWHGWEYSVVTGKGPPGYEQEQVPTFAVEVRADMVYVQTPPVTPRKLVKHAPLPLARVMPRPPDAPARVLGISTTAMDDLNPRYSASDDLLEHALTHARAVGADTRLVRLRDLNFKPCEGNYSKAAHACTWPCAITERDPDDQLTAVYEGLVQWCDVILLSTPIRWGSASALYFKMAERLNCIQNQITIRNNILISNKVAAFIIMGGQDNVQGVAGSLMTFWSELGFVFPPFPFIAHTRGWDAEDMENNVRLVRMSESLRNGAADLVERSIHYWRVLDHHRLELEKPMEKGGRKAQPLDRMQDAIPVAMETANAGAAHD
jgi:nitrite reductase/ring-hydroxylating ferredoxin subunit/multimeric flavodoxin WrbA